MRRSISEISVMGRAGALNRNFVYPYGDEEVTRRARESALWQKDRWERNYPQVLGENLSIVER